MGAMDRLLCCLIEDHPSSELVIRLLSGQVTGKERIGIANAIPLQLRYLLGLFNSLRHGQEHAVQENRGHYDVIEELVRGHSDTRSPPRIPGFEEEAALGAREPVDVVLPEPLRDDAEGLEVYEIIGYFSYILQVNINCGTTIDVRE